MINITKLTGHGDDCIRIEAIREKPGAPAIIFSSGFLSEDDSEWSHFLTKQFPEHQLLRVRWKSSSFRELLGFASGTGPGLLIAAMGGLWATARNESERAGHNLAKALNAASSESPHNANEELVPAVLLGHSLGARLMVSCLEKTYRGIIQRSVLLGGAVDAEGAAIPKVRHKTVHPTINCYSANDSVLTWIYRLGNFSIYSAIGLKAIGSEFDNYDATFEVKGHGDYCGNVAVAEIIRRGICDTSRTITQPRATQNGTDVEFHSIFTPPNARDVPVILPRLGNKEQEWEICEYHKKVGDVVCTGDRLFSVQLAKNYLNLPAIGIKALVTGTISAITTDMIRGAGLPIAFITPSPRKEATQILRQAGSESIKAPRVGSGLHEFALHWIKQEGDSVESGEAILLVGLNNQFYEIMAPQSGVVAQTTKKLTATSGETLGYVNI